MASHEDLHTDSTKPDQAAGTDAAASGSEGGSAAAAPESPSAARPAGGRRARKTAAAPVDTNAALLTTSEEDAGESSGTAEPTDGQGARPTRKTAKKAARKAAKKAAPRKRAAAGGRAKSVRAQASEAQAGEALTGEASAGEAEAVAGEVAGFSAEQPTVEVAAPEVPAAAETVSPEEQAAELAEEEPLGEGAEPQEQAVEPQEVAQSPAVATVPGFGLLFQAPEPAAPPRRRATSAAGTPGKTTAKGERAAAQPSASGKGEQPEEHAQVTQPEAVAEAPEAAEQAGEAGEAREAGEQDGGRRRSRRRGGRGRRSRVNGETEAVETAAEEGAEAAEAGQAPSGGTGPDTAREAVAEEAAETAGSRRRRRRRRSAGGGEVEDPPGTVTKVREPRKEREEPAGVKGSTRLEAKKQRRREGREAGRRRTIITEAEFLARRESVERFMVVRNRDGRTQIGVLEDGVLVEHYVSRETNASMAGNVYLGRVQNVLPSMEAAFVDIGKGRNAVLYAGEVNWDAAGLEINQPKRIENALKSGDTVLVQVTKDPIGHKGARLTSQISLPGRYLVYVPEGSMTGISRKLPDTERTRLKGILKEVVPDSAGVIVRTAAEGASEEELRADVERLTKAWQRITDRAEAKSGKKGSAGGAPVLLHGEPDLTVRVIRDVFNEDFTSLVVAGDAAWREINEYVEDVAPDLGKKLQKWTSGEDLFTHYRVDEQLAKAMDRKVWLPSGGSLVIDRTEAMTVVDVNTGKFVGSGGNLEETVTKNNLEAAEEIVRQLRLRDIGGIIVIDFIDMVLESNRDLVVRRLLECLGRDRTKHQVAEVTSLGLVQMTRKRVGSGLIEVFSEVCEHCNGRGIIVHTEPVDRPTAEQGNGGGNGSRSRGRRGKSAAPEVEALVRPSGPTPAQIAAAAHAAAIKGLSGEPQDDDVAELAIQDAPVDLVREIDDEEEDLVAMRLGEAEETERAEAKEIITSAEPSRGAEPITEAEKPSPAPRKRKRGRVVAPAGPPRHIEAGASTPSGSGNDPEVSAPEPAAAGES